MSDLEKAKGDYAWTTMVLGILFAAPAIISLIQRGLQIDLSWGFQHFVAFYRAIVAPAIDLVQTPLRGLLEWLKVDWIIPQWMKDLHALSFVMSGIYVRSWGTLAESKRRLSKRLNGHSDDGFDVKIEGDRIVRTERVKSPPANPLFAFLERLVAGVLLGFTCLAFFAWISAISSGFVNASRMSGARVLPWQRPRTVLGSTITERADTQVFRFYSLLLATAATLAAVAAFYGSNAVVPQLTFR